MAMVLLAEADLIERQPDPKDARSSYAVLTRHGRALVASARTRHHTYLQELFGLRKLLA